MRREGSGCESRRPSRVVDDAEIKKDEFFLQEHEKLQMLLS